MNAPSYNVYGHRARSSETICTPREHSYSYRQGLSVHRRSTIPSFQASAQIDRETQCPTTLVLWTVRYHDCDGRSNFFSWRAETTTITTTTNQWKEKERTEGVYDENRRRDTQFGVTRVRCWESTEWIDRLTREESDQRGTDDGFASGLQPLLTEAGHDPFRTRTQRVTVREQVLVVTRRGDSTTGAASSSSLALFPAPLSAVGSCFSRAFCLTATSPP